MSEAANTANNGDGRIRPSQDPGWSYGQPVNNNKLNVKCDLCGHASNGGIKRFKQHIVNTYKGLKFKDVAKCPKAPVHVKEEIYQYLMEKVKEREKQNEEQRQNRDVNIYDDGNEDEVKEVGQRRSIIPTKNKGPMDNFLAPIDGDFIPKEPNNTRNKKALEVARYHIADFFYENGISFNCAKSDSYHKMCQAIVQYSDPKTFKPPSYHNLRVTILKKKVEETRKWIDDFKIHWETYGVTIMTDWWTDGRRRTLINFLINCPKGTVFLKSIDGSAHTHDAKLIYEMLKEVIVEVGEKNVIQVVTDNASNYKLAGKWLMTDYKIYWTPCAAHCVNLMLSDVGNLPIVCDVVEEAKRITCFIYNHTHVLHLMRKHTEGRDLVRPAVTRFATSSLSLKSIFDQKPKLRAMINSEEWRSSKWVKHSIGKEVAKSIKRSTFWNNMHYALKLMDPLVDVIRLVDMEEKPCMGYIYKAMDICKEKVKANLGENTEEDKEMWKTLEKIIDHRWIDQLQQPLHAAAHYLNPQVYWATTTSPEEVEADREVKEGLLDCINKLSVDLEEEKKILAQLVPFRTKRGRLGKPNAQACIKDYAPVEWWVTFGSEIPDLQRFAKRVLGLISSASPCERNWSAFNNLHSKKRNRLDHQRLSDLVYIQYNKKLKKRYEQRICGKETDPIVLKSLEECQEWLVPHDARDDPVVGTDFNYGILEDAEGSENDEHPPCTTRSKKRRMDSHGGSTSSSRVTSRTRTAQFQLQDSETEDEDELVLTDDDGDDDGIDTGDDEDI